MHLLPIQKQLVPIRNKTGESDGVIAMIDSLIAELDKEMTEAETEEKLAHEQLMADSKSQIHGDGTDGDRRVL